MDNATAQAYGFVEKFNEIILFPTIALLSAVALLVFVYGCFLYIVRSTDAGARAEGVKHITWGIVGMVVMLSAYTIMSIAAGTFGLRDELDTAGEGGVVVPLPATGGGTNGGLNGGGSNGGLNGSGANGGLNADCNPGNPSFPNC